MTRCARCHRVVDYDTAHDLHEPGCTRSWCRCDQKVCAECCVECEEAA